MLKKEIKAYCKLNNIYFERKKEIIKKPIVRTEIKQNTDTISKRKISEESSSTSTDSDQDDNNQSGKKSSLTIKKAKNSDEKKEPRSSAKSSDPSAEASTITEDGNMILLKGDDSLWKNNSDKNVSSILADEKKSRENDFEDYLEDLLF